jgi:hypothetical protein
MHCNMTETENISTSVIFLNSWNSYTALEAFVCSLFINVDQNNLVLSLLNPFLLILIYIVDFLDFLALCCAVT